MLILFDHVTPRGIARFLAGHVVTSARERGWETLTTGDLLAEGERAGFDVFLTGDKNIQYRQNLAGRKIAIVVLSTPQWPLGRVHVAKIATARSTQPRPEAIPKYRFRTTLDVGGPPRLTEIGCSRF